MVLPRGSTGPSGHAPAAARRRPGRRSSGRLRARERSSGMIGNTTRGSRPPLMEHGVAPGSCGALFSRQGPVLDGPNRSVAIVCLLGSRSYFTS